MKAKLKTPSRLLILVLPALFGAVSASANLGDKIPLKSAPWSVSLRSEDAFHGCGATLIAPKWLLTAGDCAEWMDSDIPASQQISAWAGSASLKKLRALPPVKAVHYAPGFEFKTIPIKFFKLTLGERNTVKNNLALLELERPVDPSWISLPAGASAKKRRRFETRAIAPIALSNETPKTGDRLFFSGWGDGPRGARHLKYGPSIDLRGFSADYLTNEEAASEMRRSGFARSSIREYVDREEFMTVLDEKSTCTGDSGAGVVKFEADGTPVLVGVNSHGDSLCSDELDLRSSTATRITPFFDWIRKTMKASESP